MPRKAYEARWPAPGEGGTDFVQRNLSPSAAEPVEGAEVGDVVDIGERISMDGIEDVTALGSALHTVIAAEIAAPVNDPGARAQSILDAWGSRGNIGSKEALAAAANLRSWIEDRLTAKAIYVEHPLTMVQTNGQVIHGFVDLLVDTGEGWVLIDHKASPRPRSEWQEVAFAYSGQLAMYKRAIEAVTGKPVLETWIYFPVGGGLVQVSV